MLPGDVFDVPIRIDIMHQVVRWQRAKAQQVTSCLSHPHLVWYRHAVRQQVMRLWLQLHGNAIPCCHKQGA